MAISEAINRTAGREGRFQIPSPFINYFWFIGEDRFQDRVFTENAPMFVKSLGYNWGQPTILSDKKWKLIWDFGFRNSSHIFATY
ncbi:hypothetical protein FKM82_018085 [Ascaphus truei]